jgi:hypothetical protein
MYKFSSEEGLSQSEVYHNLNKAGMIGADNVNVVEYDNNMQGERRGSSVSGRYSKWPSCKIFVFMLY